MHRTMGSCADFVTSPKETFFTFSREFSRLSCWKLTWFLLSLPLAAFLKISLKTSNLFWLNCAKLFFWSSAFFQPDRSKSKNVMSRRSRSGVEIDFETNFFFQVCRMIFFLPFSQNDQWWQSVIWLKLVLVSRFCFYNFLLA